MRLCVNTRNIQVPTIDLHQLIDEHITKNVSSNKASYEHKRLYKLAESIDFANSYWFWKFLHESKITYNTKNICKDPLTCLLYTSDAADDSLRVYLGGRRISKKL